MCDNNSPIKPKKKRSRRLASFASRRAAQFLSSGQIDTVECEGDTCTFTSFSGAKAVVRILAYEEPAQPIYSPPSAPFDLFYLRPEWSAEELRERGLPLEWSREWLVEQLGRNQNKAAVVAREHGIELEALEKVIAVHGIQNAQKELVVKLWASGCYATKKALAEELGLTSPQISNYIGAPKRSEHNQRVLAIFQQVAEECPQLSPTEANNLIVQRLQEEGDPRNYRKILSVVKRIRTQQSP